MTTFLKYHLKSLAKGIAIFGAITAFIALFFISSFAVYASTMPPAQANQALYLRPIPPLTFSTALNSGSGSISANWSGYVAQNQGTSYTGVAGSWIVPNVASVSAFEADATWVGIGGVTGTDLIQAGTETIISASGQTTYQAWYELLPQASVVIPVAVKSGDFVTASLAQTSPNVWQINFRDNTTGQNYTTSVNYASSLSSSEWIEEMPSTENTFVPLDNFGSLSFSDASTVANGASLTIAASGAAPLNMLNNASQALAVPSALGADGASFTVTRTSASATVGGGSGFYTGGMPNGRRPWRTGVGIRGFTRPSSITHVTRSFSVGGWTIQIYQRVFSKGF